MDTKKLVFRLSILALVLGAILVCVTPGGFLNRQPQTVAMEVPMFGQMRVEASGPGLGNPGPVSGFLLIGLGAVGLVVASAMGPTPGKPDPIA